MAITLARIEAEERRMHSTKRTSRIAGLLDLVNAITRLFRIGIVSELICAVKFLFLVWILYRLLGGVNKTQASLMVILGVAFVPIMCLNVLNDIAALTLLRGADFLSVFDK